MIGLIGDNEAESRLSLSVSQRCPPSLPHVKVMAQKVEEGEGTLIKRECSASEFDEVSCLQTLSECANCE